MASHREMIQGELERLFLDDGLNELCSKYLGIDAVELGFHDPTRSVFARRLLSWCEKENATEALVDAILIEKKAQADRRIRSVAQSRYPSGNLAAGTRGGNFVIKEKTGEGSFGSIYRCVRADVDADEDSTEYGMRVIRGEHALDPEATNRFKTLMRSLMTNYGPAVERVVEVGDMEDGRIYVVFLATKGLPIREFVPLEVLDALDMLDSVMRALDEVHQFGLVHGNLNTENVIIRAVPRDEGGRQNVTLLGFGVDRLLHRPTAVPTTTQVFGRFAGLTPEQAKGEEPTARTDIYALGALLYELVCGKPPFSGNTPIELVAAHLLKPIPTLSDQSDNPAAEALDEIIVTMMAKAPTQRPANLDAVRVMMGAARRQVEVVKARTSIPGTRDDIQESAAVFLKNPANEAAFTRLRSDAKKHNAWSAVVETIEEGAAASGDQNVARQLVVEAARIAIRQGRDYVKAAQLIAKLTKAFPNDPESQGVKRELLYAEGRYEELIEDFVALADATDDAREKDNWLRKIGDVYHEDLKDHSTALDYYLACVQIEALDTDLLESLDNLAARTERFADLTAKFCEFAHTAENSERQDAAVFFYKTAAKHYVDQLDEPANSLSCYLKVLELSPGDIEVLKSVAALYRAANQFSELTEVLMMLTEMEATPVARREHMVESASILYDNLGQSDQAIALYETVIADDPSQPKAVEVLSNHYENAGEWQKLSAILAASVDSQSDGPQRADALHHLGELNELHLDDLKDAESYYQKVLEIEPHHGEALTGMERIFTRNGDGEGLRANLITQLECENTPKKEVAIKGRLATLLEEEFKNVEGAIQLLLEILALDAKEPQALESLTRLYRTTENWPELAAILKTRAIVAESDEKKDLLKQRASVLREKIGDAKQAAEVFKEMASFGEGEALDTLALAQEEAGDFGAAVSTVQKMIDDASEVEPKVKLMLRVARLQMDRLENPQDGVSTLRTIQNIAPENQEVLRELRRGLVLTGNYTAALDVATQEIGLAEGNNARADLIAEVGVVCLDYIGDTEWARERFEKAIALDRNNLVASDRLSELYRLNGEWDFALQIYEYWENSSDALTLEKRIELFTRMAEAYEQLGKPEKALETYQKLSDFSEQDGELALKVGKAALESGEYQLAGKQFRSYMKKMGDSLSDVEKVEVLISYGRAEFSAGDDQEAARAARQATVMNPSSRDGLLLLADVLEKRRDYRGFIDAAERVLAGMDTADPDHVALLRRIAMVLFEKYRDNDGAIKKLSQALDIDADNRAVLNDLLKIFTATKQYQKVVETLLRAASLVDDPKQLAKYFVAIAKVYGRELRQDDSAVEYYEKALVMDPSLKAAEEALVRILGGANQWDRLANLYRDAADRLPEDATVEQKVDALRPLSSVLVNKLMQREEGIRVVETLAGLEPKNLEWQEQLGELYGWEKEYIGRAVPLHRGLLMKKPERVDSFHKLFNIFCVENQADKAWCVSSILAILDQCTAEERDYYHQYLPEDVPALSNILDNNQWNRDLTHHSMNQTVSMIYSAIAPIILSVQGWKLADLGLRQADAVDVKADKSVFSGFVDFVSTTLGVVPPPLFFRTPENGSFDLMGADIPVIFADNSDAMMSDRKGIAFCLGQQLTLLRPGLFVHKLVRSGTELSAWLLASIKSFVPKLPVQNELAGPVAERLAPMRSLDPQSLERLQGYVQSFQSETQNIDTKKWGRAVEYTMDRAGLIICGDADTAVRMLKTQVTDPQRRADRLKELAIFGVSEEYFRLREYLGTSLKTG